MSEPKRPTGMCKDCWEDPQRFLRKERPAPHPGPRCFTHHLAATKARKAKAQAARDAKVYGLAEGGYEQLLAIQGGHCYICERATGATRRLSVDHDHQTGDIRGLLCRPCNSMLGHLRDNPVAFERTIRYLRNPPAMMLADKFILPRGE